jgi:hypothetical protein
MFTFLIKYNKMSNFRGSEHIHIILPIYVSTYTNRRLLYV